MNSEPVILDMAAVEIPTVDTVSVLISAVLLTMSSATIVLTANVSVQIFNAISEEAVMVEVTFALFVLKLEM